MKRVSLALLLSVVAGFAQAESLLSVKAGWVRWVPPVSHNSAAYFTIENKGEKPVDLLAIDSAVAANVELHTVEKDGDVMAMKKLDKVTIPAGESVEFKPGGNHVMLIGLKQPLQKTQSVDMTLKFSNSESLSSSLPVTDGDEGGEHHHHHHH